MMSNQVLGMVPDYSETAAPQRRIASGTRVEHSMRAGTAYPVSARMLGMVKTAAPQRRITASTRLEHSIRSAAVHRRSTR
jgi:hypothetical protein